MLVAVTALGACGAPDPAARLAGSHQQLVGPAWGMVGAMTSPRDYHTATLLPSGKVLVVGGVRTGGGLSTAEQYDPATGKWTATGSLATPRYYHTATLLRSGKVLVVGGAASTFLATAELYDPATGRWTATGSLAETRADHAAILLQSGKVLVVGGTGLTTSGTFGYRATAEIYDPATGTWTATGSLSAARRGHTATLLASGKVLVAGGSYPSGPSSVGYLASAELYDPTAGTWSATGSLAAGRESHTATLLPSGQVLVAGGSDGGVARLATAETYDPSSETWSAAGPLAAARERHTATLLPSGKVLVEGGYNPTGILAAAELYDPAAGTWGATASLGTARERHTATLLPSGKVLVAGGFGPTPGGPTSYGQLDSAELHDPTTGSWISTGSLSNARDHHTATLLASGKVLVVGGFDGTSYVSSAELYDPSTTTWSGTSYLGSARYHHTATLLASGKVLVVGGYNAATSAELYDPATETWSTTGSLATIRTRHSATLLPSGKVLVVGSNSSTAELYDPATGTWSATGSLGTARGGETSTRLASGKVLVVGGYGAISPGNYGWLASAEIYDPSNGTWSTTGSLATARERHTATLLPSGKVLVAGGTGTSGVVADAEVFDPTTGTWSAAASLAEARHDHTATLLPSGSVLLAGGYGATARLASAELYDPATGTWSTTGSLASARDAHTATLLPSGQVLLAAGYLERSLSSVELFDDGRGARPEWTPKVAGGSRGTTSGGAITLEGTLFTGVSEGSSGGTQSSPANNPVVQLQAADGDLTNVLPTSWSATSLAVTMSAAVASGPYWVRVIVSGVPSEACQLTVVPPLVASPKILAAAPRGSFTFTASGGSGTGYLWSLETNASGGTVNETTGRYVAGSTGSVTDVLRVTDSLGLTATANAVVGAGVSISPSPATVAPGASQTFTASGGSGNGYTWSLATDASGATIGSSSGAYRAGTTGNVIDVVDVVDSFGNTATANVTVSDPITITPASATVSPRGSQAFTASGGSGTGYGWSLSTNASGATIDPTTGAYTAGANGGTDVVVVTDSLGNTSSANVTVTATPPQTGDGGGGCGCGNGGGGSSLLLLVLGALSLSRARMGLRRCSRLRAASPVRGTTYSGGCKRPVRSCGVPSRAMNARIRRKCLLPSSRSSTFAGETSRLALLLAMSALAACGAQDPSAPLTARYPQAAQRILAGPGFVRGEGGFVAADPATTESDPVKAAEASLGVRGGMQLELPEHGARAAVMKLPGGLTIELTERGLVGPGKSVGGALAYPRADGTSYWMATGEGFEEWIEVENAGDRPVGEWEVKGAALRQEGDAAAVVDDGGTVQARVTAPQAVSAAGVPARAWLRVEGQVLALYTDARGPALVDPAWTTVGSLGTTRSNHTATLLPSGKVLVAGGLNASTTLNTAQLYDPATGRWSTTGPLLAARSNHTATLLTNGKVLVAGGNDGSTYLPSAELYDPAAGTWSAAGSLNAGRNFHTATPAPGHVLVAGGYGTGGAAKTAELYDELTGSWTSTGSLTGARYNHTAALLTNGKVLVAGGYGPTGPSTNGALNTAELYDFSTKAWSSTGSLGAARYHHTATVLASGKVLASGGYTGSSAYASSELYDPANGTWAPTGSLTNGRYHHTATLLPNGKVLVAGGSGTSGTLSTAELYDPSAGTWATTTSLVAARYSHTATLLDSGSVLVAGGYGTTYLASTELHDPTTGRWSTTGSLAAGRIGHTATLLTNGKVLVVAGGRSTAELFNPTNGAWSATGSPGTARGNPSATLLMSGKVLLVGGASGTTYYATAELYEPVSGTWSATGQLAWGRRLHTATLLPSGKVLVVGGYGMTGVTTTGTLASAELFDPATGKWTTTGSLASARLGHTATLLPSGKVLVAGGTAGPTALASTELYDPATGTWTTTGSLGTGRFDHTATLLASGRVLVAGGDAGTTYVGTAEVYNPSSGTWSTTGSLVAARSSQSATLLTSGKVLVAGGFGSIGVATDGALLTAELYDPATSKWSATGPLAAARFDHTATLLPSGKVLVAAGDSDLGNLASAELFDEGRGALAAMAPTLMAGSQSVPSGSELVFFGSLFTGISEGSSGTTQSGATNFPIVQIQAVDGGGLTYLLPSAPWSDQLLYVAVPADVVNGPSWVRVIVSGVPSAAWQTTVVPRLVISPPGTTLLSGASQTFTVSGGSSAGYVWSLATNASGATINGTTGVYTAGAKTGATDVVKVTDSLGNTATVNVTINAPVAITPASATVAPKASQSFAATGGSGTGYAWSLATNSSGGTIDAVTGAYTAGSTGSVVDVVRLTDSLGNTLTANVTVTAGVSMGASVTTLPPRGSYTYTASGGSGTGYTWSLTSNGSGGTINPSTGAYTAGATGGVTDVIQVTDSLGNTLTANVTITAGVSMGESVTTLPPKGSYTYTASGGSGTGYTWSLTSNGSGGTINPSTGAYTAGATGGVTDIIKVTDSLGNTSTLSIAVAAGVSITPDAPALAAGATQTFAAAGGSGTGYTWSLSTNASGATIDPSTGAYTAGTNAGTDVVVVTDSLGNTSSVNVTITATPPQTGDGDGGGGGGCGCGNGGGSSLLLLVLGALSLSRARVGRGRARHAEPM